MTVPLIKNRGRPSWDRFFLRTRRPDQSFCPPKGSAPPSPPHARNPPCLEMAHQPPSKGQYLGSQGHMTPQTGPIGSAFILQSKLWPRVFRLKRPLRPGKSNFMCFTPAWGPGWPESFQCGCPLGGAPRTHNGFKKLSFLEPQRGGGGESIFDPLTQTQPQPPWPEMAPGPPKTPTPGSKAGLMGSTLTVYVNWLAVRFAQHSP